MNDKRSHNRLEHFPISFFATVMGATGLAVAWQKRHAVLGAPPLIGQVLSWCALALFALLVFIYAAKWAGHPAAVRAELAAKLQLTDLALFTEARYTRHLSLVIERKHFTKCFRQIINSDGCFHDVLSLPTETFFKTASAEAADDGISCDRDKHQDQDNYDTHLIPSGFDIFHGQAGHAVGYHA